MSFRTLFAVLGVLGALVLAAGCGDDSEDGDAGGGSAAPSKAEFVEQASALCQQNRKDVLSRIVAYQKENGRLNSRDVGAEAVGETLLPVLQEEVEEVRGLGVPSGDEAEVEAFLSAREKALDTIEEDGLSSNEELFAEFKRSDQLAQEYGLEACSFGF